MEFWFIVNGKPAGPFSYEQASSLPFIATSPAWKPGLPQWVSAIDIPELAEILRIRSGEQQSTAEPVATPETETENVSSETVVTEPQAETQTEPEPEKEPEPEPQPQPEPQKAPVLSEPRFEVYASAQFGDTQDDKHIAKLKKDMDSYMIWSIILTILCCVPLGLVSLFLVFKGSKKIDRGDTAGAEKLAEIIPWLLILSIVLGLVTAPFISLISAL